MTPEEKAKLDALKFEMANSTQQNVYPGFIWPGTAFATHDKGAYATGEDLNTNLNPFKKNADIEQLQQQQAIEEDPERFNRIRRLLEPK